VIEEVFGVAQQEVLLPRYNVAPTQPILVAIQDAGSRALRTMRWGLTPRWARAKVGPRGGLQLSSFINARSESIEVKPSFREAFSRRRCLIPANAFYEWKNTPDGKRPHAIAFEGFPLFAMGGIWETWSSEEGESREGACVVTTRATSRLTELHDRMPVLIHQDHFDLWLGERTPSPVLRGLMEPIPDGLLTVYPVGDDVNRADAEGETLLAPR
jgi:putative SOS response-associated peptidase YedK